VPFLLAHGEMEKKGGGIASGGFKKKSGKGKVLQRRNAYFAEGGKG